MQIGPWFRQILDHSTFSSNAMQRTMDVNMQISPHTLQLRNSGASRIVHIFSKAQTIFFWRLRVYLMYFVETMW